MSMKGYYVPNRVSNEYIDNKRNEEGEYEYDSYVRDVGMNTQAAIQSLNKDYSTAINNAYSQYLNSKYSINTSNIIQGSKEALLQKQQEALQANIAQASLTANETKQQILQQAYEQQNAIGEAFQTEVNNMEQVGTMLSGYMEYLKGVTDSSGTSYYDAILAGKGLTDYAKDNEIYAEDIYDELYNAQLKGFETEDSEAALGWIDWLNTQIKTDKQQNWYDWYMGQGGYEQFRDAYKKGIYSKDESSIAEYLAEQARKREYETAKSKAEEDYNIEKYNAEQAHNKQLEEYAKLSKDYSVPRSVSEVLDWHDYGNIDWGEKAHDKIMKTVSWVDSWAKNTLNLSEEEIKQATGGLTIKEAIKEIAIAGDKINKGISISDLFKEGGFWTGMLGTVTGMYTGPIERALKAGDTRAAVKQLYDALVDKLRLQKVYNDNNFNPDFKYKDFEFASYEDYYK